MRNIHVSEALFYPVTQAWCQFLAHIMLQPVGASCRVAHVLMRAEEYVRAAWGSSCTTAVDEALRHSWPISAAVSILVLQYH